MLNIHICTHCDTFLSKEDQCVSHVNGKGDWGNERDIQAVLHNRNELIFAMPWFWIIRLRVKMTESDYQYGTRNVYST